MFIDSREIPNGHAIHADVCIIGAGAAGITMARELKQSVLSVCVLESGGFEPDLATQSLYEGKASQSFLNEGSKHLLKNMDEYLMASRFRMFGGTTNIWSGWCRPLDDLDFEQRDWVPYSGWPFVKSELEPFYQRAYPIVEIKPFDYEETERETNERSLYRVGDNLKITNKFFHYSSPTRFGQVYRKDLETATNISVYLYANALNVKVNNSASSVERVEVGSLEGNRFSVEAKIYVLAMGGVENARVLLNSDTIEKSGVGNEHDLVGRFFMEHLGGDESAGGMYLSATREEMSFYGRRIFDKSFGHKIMPVLCPKKKTQQEYRLLNGELNIQYWAMPENKPSSMVLTKPHDVMLQNAHEFHHFLASRNTKISALFSDSSDEKPNRKPYYARLGISMEQAPNPSSRILLTQERDALEMRKVKLDWQLTPLDYQSIEDLVVVLGKELGRMQQGRARVYISPRTPTPLKGGWHHMGTTRMHVNPKEGVVNQNCRVHGVDNLYVAGSSVFPTVGFANPTLTLVALALRLADHLERKLGA